MHAEQTLLVLVGNGSDRLMPGLVLRPLGFTVLECACAQEAMALLLQQPLAAALIDVQTAAMCGLEVLQCFRHHPMHQHTQAIACTFHATQEEQAFWHSQGFDAVLLKPFRSVDLLRLLVH